MKIELTGKKTKEIRKLIFSILDILAQIGVPLSGKTDRRLERMAEACLAVGKIQTTFPKPLPPTAVYSQRHVTLFHS